MKLFYVLIILFFFGSCSFDKKTGIWKNNSLLSDKNQIESDELLKLNKILTNKEAFNRTVNLDKNFEFRLSSPINNTNWSDFFYDQSNNLNNFKFNGQNKIIYKSKRLSRNESNEFILFSNNKVIFSDEKGNIIFYSISDNRIIHKFNFYKKKYKHYKKKLNLIIDKKIVFVSDNLGYIYSYNYEFQKILWAKNYKVPFRSNLKIQDDKLFVSNQNNDLLILKKNSGNILKKIPTEPTIIKNKFINNIALDEGKTMFYLNSYGSLYAVDLAKLEVKWFINLNQTFSLNPSNLFMGNQVVYKKKKIVVSSNYNTYIIDADIGSILFKGDYSTEIKPIINNRYLFLITKNNYLVSVNLANREILYSYKIEDKIAQFLDIKKSKVQVKSFAIINNNLLILLSNSYLLNFNIKGDLKEIKKIKSKIKSQPIFIEGTALFLDYKNRLVILN